MAVVVDVMATVTEGAQSREIIQRRRNAQLGAERGKGSEKRPKSGVN